MKATNIQWIKLIIILEQYKIWDLNKRFYRAKETIDKIKGQLSEWEKIIWNEVDKGLISKIHKLLIQLSIRKINSQFNKWAEHLNKHFSKEDIQMADKHLKIYSTLLIIREMQIETTMRYHLIPVRKTIIKKATNNKFWRGRGKKGNFLYYW